MISLGCHISLRQILSGYWQPVAWSSTSPEVLATSLSFNGSFLFVFCFLFPFSSNLSLTFLALLFPISLFLIIFFFPFSLFSSSGRTHSHAEIVTGNRSFHRFSLTLLSLPLSQTRRDTKWRQRDSTCRPPDKTFHVLALQILPGRSTSAVPFVQLERAAQSRVSQGPCLFLLFPEKKTQGKPTQPYEGTITKKKLKMAPQVRSNPRNNPCCCEDVFPQHYFPPESATFRLALHHTGAILRRSRCFGGCIRYACIRKSSPLFPEVDADSPRRERTHPWPSPQSRMEIQRPRNWCSAPPSSSSSSCL